jgi:hypothetical protein
VTFAPGVQLLPCTTTVPPACGCGFVMCTPPVPLELGGGYVLDGAADALAEKNTAVASNTPSAAIAVSARVIVDFMGDSL